MQSQNTLACQALVNDRALLACAGRVRSWGKVTATMSPDWTDCDSGVAGGVGTIISNGVEILPIPLDLRINTRAVVGARRRLGWVLREVADILLEGAMLKRTWPQARLGFAHTYSHISCSSGQRGKKTFRGTGR